MPLPPTSNLNLQQLEADIGAGGLRAEVCRKLVSLDLLFSLETGVEFSEVLGFDARRLVAAHNILVAGSHSSSLSLNTLYGLCSGMVEKTGFEFFVRDVCMQNQMLKNTKFDQVNKIFHFPTKPLSDEEYAREVLLSL